MLSTALFGRRQSSIIHKPTKLHKIYQHNTFFFFFKHEIHLISYKFEHFQQNCLKIYPFSASKLYPGIQFRLPCTPGTIFHGCQFFYWDPSGWETKVSPQKIGFGYVKTHGVHGNP